MSEYPTTADLAAFRRSFEPSDPESHAGMLYWDAYDDASQGGAWPHEREHGIGTRTKPFGDAMLDDAGPYARREANRMRHEAYERMEGYAETNGRGSPFTDAWDTAILTFTPGATIHPPERLPDPPRIYPSSWDDDVMSAWHEHQRLHS